MGRFVPVCQASCLFAVRPMNLLAPVVSGSRGCAAVCSLTIRGQGIFLCERQGWVFASACLQKRHGSPRWRLAIRRRARGKRATYPFHTLRPPPSITSSLDRLDSSSPPLVRICAGSFCRPVSSSFSSVSSGRILRDGHPLLWVRLRCTCCWRFCYPTGLVLVLLEVGPSNHGLLSCLFVVRGSQHRSRLLVRYHN